MFTHSTQLINSGSKVRISEVCPAFLDCVLYRKVMSLFKLELIRTSNKL